MAPVHDFRHVEIDKIGRGKRSLKPPGGETSDIFGAQADNPHEQQKLTPRRGSYMASTIFTPENGTNGFHSPPQTPSPPNGSTGKKQGYDTQARLFGPPIENGIPKRIIDRQKSNIFTPESTAAKTRTSVKSAARRNPITGEFSDGSPKLNGYVNGHISMNGDTPDSYRVRQRNPPGGKCSGIF